MKEVRQYKQLQSQLNIMLGDAEALRIEVSKLVEALGGNGSYPNDGFSVVMKNYTVTTVV